MDQCVSTDILCYYIHLGIKNIGHKSMVCLLPNCLCVCLSVCLCVCLSMCVCPAVTFWQQNFNTTHQILNKNSIQASLSCHTHEETHTGRLSCTNHVTSVYKQPSFHLLCVCMDNNCLVHNSFLERTHRQLHLILKTNQEGKLSDVR